MEPHPRCPTTPNLSGSPSPCYLDVLHILAAHIAGEGEDAVLAKARGATIVHWKPGRDQTGWSSDIPGALDTLSSLCEVGLGASCIRCQGKGPRGWRWPSGHMPFHGSCKLVHGARGWARAVSDSDYQFRTAERPGDEGSTRNTCTDQAHPMTTPQPHQS